MNKLPLGIYTFEKIRHGGFLYIDKTKYIHELTQHTDPILLTRPKRFGKTLLLSTIKSIFAGRKKLFKGLWLYDQQCEWEPYPIIHLDMAKVNCKTPENFAQTLTAVLTKKIKAANLQVRGQTPAEIFHSFIVDLELAHRRKVVVLIDEYDLPIIGNVTHPDNLPAIWEQLVALYGVPRAAKDSLRFVFYAGVCRFDPQALFPGQDALRDITFDPAYAPICGLTVEEFDLRFPPYLEVVLSALETEGICPGKPGQDRLRADLLDWYGGYSWDGKTKLINLFRLLQFFRAKELNNFWQTPKTPPFLVNLAKKHDLVKRLTDGELSLDQAENVIDPADVAPLPALSQTGYLSVSRTSRRKGGIVHKLDMPNLSARWSLLIHCMAKEYNLKPGQLWGEMDQILKSLKNQNARVTALAFKRLLASLKHAKSEGTPSEHYGRIFSYLALTLGHTFPAPEGHGARETVDCLMKTGDGAYLAIGMSHHRLPVPVPGPGNRDDEPGEEEWRYPSEEILALEERLSGPAMAYLGRIEGSGRVRRLREGGFAVTPAALVVHGDSVVKAVYGKG